MNSRTETSPIAQLRDPHSAKRRAAAKTLRKSGDHTAVPDLVNALEKEIADRRTWETQYQMVMALAACGARSSLPLLHCIRSMPVEPMVLLAVGDAIVRLSEDIDNAILNAIESGNTALVEGAFRAIAMTHGVPTAATQETMIRFAARPEHQQLRFWLAAAAAGWKAQAARLFLSNCLNENDAATRKAAQASLEGRYLKWNPL